MMGMYPLRGLGISVTLEPLHHGHPQVVKTYHSVLYTSSREVSSLLIAEYTATGLTLGGTVKMEHVYSASKYIIYRCDGFANGSSTVL